MLHPDEEKAETVLSGEVASALDPPAGCRFHPRYPVARPSRTADEPQREAIALGHQVAGHGATA